MRELPRHVLFANVAAELGGAEQVILSLAERLPAYGVEVSFALFRPGPLAGILASRGIRVHVYPQEYRFRQLKSLWKCVHWLADCVREDQADLIHSNLTAHFVAGWSARIVGIPEVWHLHDYPFQFEIVHFLSRFLPASHYIFTTEFLKSGEPMLARRPHSVITPNCIDIEALSAMEVPGSETLARFGLQSGAFFLTVSRLQKAKGHRYLIEAAAKVFQSHPDIHWILAGKARGEVQEAYRASLEQQITELGMTGRIHLAGFVSDEDIAVLFREGLALVHPALTEGYGLVLIEAMAHGLPVIAAAASGPAEILHNEQTGLLVPVKDADALQTAMERLLDSQELRGRLSAGARASLKRKDVHGMVEATIEAYRQTMAGYPR